ncbi:MAG: hydantoinase/oxoprolinase family protein, partial [Gammaproteobacteria bacterium]
MLVGVDCGGTFTDFVVCDADGVRFHKQLSTPDDPSRAILNGIRALGLDAGSLHLVHGSTVATNAVLERKGVRTLFVTNRGLEDLLALGRQVRRELYNLTPEPYGRLLPADDCLGVGGRVDADGCLVEPIDEESLQALADRAGDYEAVAICTLFSFLNPIQESELAAVLPAHVFASLSHRVLPEYREYERAST